MNPSPIKQTRHSKTDQTVPIPAKRPQLNGGLEELSADEEDGDRVQIEAGAESLDPEDEEDDSPAELYAFTIDPPTLLNDLIEIAKQVGQKQDKRTKLFETITNISGLKSNAGRTLDTRLSELSNAYAELHLSMTGRSEISMHTSRRNISDHLKSLGDEVQRTLSNILTDPDIGKTRPKMVKNVLIDLYFIVLPKWLECVRDATEICSEDGKMSLPSLEQLFHLSKLYCDLAGSAVGLEHNQPTPGDIIRRDRYNHGLDFRVRQPVKAVLKEMQLLRQKFHRKLRIIDREAIESAKADQEQLRKENQEIIPSTNDEELRTLQLERERKRIADEESEEMEKQKLIRARHRQQRQDMERIQADHAILDASWRKRKYRHQSTAGSSAQDRGPFDVDEEDDPFSDNYQRLKGVFPSNNRRQSRNPPMER